MALTRNWKTTFYVKTSLVCSAWNFDQKLPNCKIWLYGKVKSTNSGIKKLIVEKLQHVHLLLICFDNQSYNSPQQQACCIVRENESKTYNFGAENYWSILLLFLAAVSCKSEACRVFKKTYMSDYSTTNFSLTTVFISSIEIWIFTFTFIRYDRVEKSNILMLSLYF